MTTKKTTKKAKPVKENAQTVKKKTNRKPRKQPAKKATNQVHKVKEVSNVDLVTKHQVVEEVKEAPVQKKGFFRRVLGFFSLK